MQQIWAKTTKGSPESTTCIGQLHVCSKPLNYFILNVLWLPRPVVLLGLCLGSLSPSLSRWHPRYPECACWLEKVNIKCEIIKHNLTTTELVICTCRWHEGWFRHCAILSNVVPILVSSVGKFEKLHKSHLLHSPSPLHSLDALITLAFRCIKWVQLLLDWPTQNRQTSR